MLIGGAVYACLAVATWAIYLGNGKELSYDFSRDSYDDHDDVVFDHGDVVSDEFAEPAESPPLYANTAIDREAVGVVVGTEAGAPDPETTLCTAAEAGSGVGFWTCGYRPSRGGMLGARLKIAASGKYRGVFTDLSGVERGFAGCCLTAEAGASGP